jgi:hypothetical protein
MRASSMKMKRELEVAKVKSLENFVLQYSLQLLYLDENLLRTLTNE